jgi:DNA end-binding protein Ku
MSPRANWKGYLKTAELSCPVALFTAVSASERIAFHTVNRKTMHRIHRKFVDSETGAPVEAADQVKGYETDRGRYVTIEPDEIAAAIPESDKTLKIEAFIACASIDDLYFNRPYYLAPSGVAADEAFTLLRDGMHKLGVAAIARALLFRRMRTLLVRAHGKGLIATTLSFDYEVRSAAAAFEDLPKLKPDREMMDLAKHIIATKKGDFDIKAFDDRYEAALAETVQAKIQGKRVAAKAPVKPTKTGDLLEALRRSAGSAPAPKKAPVSHRGKIKRATVHRPLRKTA